MFVGVLHKLGLAYPTDSFAGVGWSHSKKLHTSRRDSCVTRVFGVRGRSLLQAVDRFSEAVGFLIEDKS